MQNNRQKITHKAFINAQQLTSTLFGPSKPIDMYYGKAVLEQERTTEETETTEETKEPLSFPAQIKLVSIDIEKGKREFTAMFTTKTDKGEFRTCIAGGDLFYVNPTASEEEILIKVSFGYIQGNQHTLPDLYDKFVDKADGKKPEAAFANN